MKREFVINRHGKDYVLYAGLLDEAHQQGLRGIKTELVQAPVAQNGNVAICVAEVMTEKGTFTGIGDADPSNVNRMMVNALIRMAETRAKARALRDAVNVAMVAIEELSESAPETLMIDDLQETAQTALPAASATPAAVPAAAPATIVSLASVRQQAATHAVAESTTAAGPSVPLPTPPTPAEPVRLPVTRAAQRTAGSAATSSGTSSGGPSSLKVAPEGPPPPATPTQLETIAKLARSVGRTVSTEGLSRAAASELITRLSEERYGARRAP